jgi:hypothetical protein
MTEILNPALRDEYITMGGGTPRRDFSYLPNGNGTNAKEREAAITSRMIGLCGAVASLAWLTLVAFMSQGEWSRMVAGDLTVIGSVSTLAIGPLGILWMLMLYIQRGMEHQTTLTVLRRLGQQVTSPVDKAESRLQALNEATERQVKMLTDAANSAANRIDQSRQSLRHETEALTAVSARSIGEVDRLGSLLRDGAQVVDRVISQVSEQAGRLEGQTHDMILSLERYATDVCSKLESSNESLLNTADQTQIALGQMSNDIERRYAGINNMAQSLVSQLEKSGGDLADRMVAFEETIAWSEQLVERVAEPLGQHTQGLKIATVQAVKAMRAANGMMEEQLNRYRTIGAQAAADTKAAQQHMSQQVNNYEQAARHALAVSFEAQQATEKRIAALEDAGQSLVDKIITVTEEMNSSTIHLGTTSERAISDIASTVTTRFEELRGEVESAVNMLGAVAHEATTASERVIESSERVIESSRSLSEATKETEVQADNLSAVETNLVKHLRSIESNLADRVNSLDEITDRGVNLAKTLDGTINDSIANAMKSLDVSLEKVASHSQGIRQDLNDVANDLVEKLAEGRREMSEQSGHILRDISETVQGSVLTMRQEGDNTHDQVKKLADNLSQQLRDTLESEINHLEIVSERSSTMQRDISNKVSDLAKTADQACQSFVTVRDMLDQQVVIIGNVANDSAGKLEAVNIRLGQQAGRIAESAAQASGSLEMASGRLSGELAAIGETTSEAEKRIITITGRFADEVGNLRSTVQKTESDLDTLMSQFARRGNDIGEMTRSASQNINNVVERLESASSTINSTVDQSVTKISLVNTSLDERVGMVRSTAERAAVDLRQTIDDLRMRIAGMEQAPASVCAKFAEMHRQLGDQIDDINVITDRMALRIDSMGTGVENRVGRLSAILTETTSNLFVAGGRVQEYLEQMVNNSTNNQDRVREISAGMKQESERFAEIGNQSVEKINGVLQSLRLGVNLFSGEAAQQIDKLDIVRVGIANQSSQFVTATDSVLSRIGHIDSKMQEQRLSFTSAYDATLNRLEDSTISLGIRLQELGDRTQRVVKSLEGAGGSLNQQAERLMEAAHSVQSTSSDAADVYRRQASTLIEASKGAAEQAKIIRQNELDARRDAFLSAAKFVIESLHSISVDFTRMMDDDVPEKVWKSFQKGDTGAFTRRLVAAKDKLSVDRIHDLYQKNSEFRSFVQRYLRQFEEVFSKAINTDHGDLLSSTFMTSDIGKLYMALCQGVGREPLSGETLDDNFQGVA